MHPNNSKNSTELYFWTWKHKLWVEDRKWKWTRQVGQSLQKPYWQPSSWQLLWHADFSHLAFLVNKINPTTILIEWGPARGARNNQIWLGKGWSCSWWGNFSYYLHIALEPWHMSWGWKRACMTPFHPRGFSCGTTRFGACRNKCCIVQCFLRAVTSYKWIRRMFWEIIIYHFSLFYPYPILCSSKYHSWLCEHYLRGRLCVCIVCVCTHTCTRDNSHRK